jgi:hypothetical protein
VILLCVRWCVANAPRLRARRDRAAAHRYFGQAINAERQTPVNFSRDVTSSYHIGTGSPRPLLRRKNRSFVNRKSARNLSSRFSSAGCNLNRGGMDPSWRAYRYEAYVYGLDTEGEPTQPRPANTGLTTFLEAGIVESSPR